MRRLTRYAQILGIQLRASATVGMQYRLDFLIEGLTTVFWMLVTLTPLFVIFGGRKSIAGWSYPEALVVVGWFTLLKGVLDGAINPSLLALIEYVRKGTLDFVLIKPVDAQFLVSTAKFDPWRLFDGLGAFAIFGYAFVQLGRGPSVGNVAAALVLLLAARLVLYSILVMVVSIAFVAVRVDNLTYFFNSIFDAARWPISVFRGALRFVFTFVFPLAVMTSFPALALLGKLELPTAVGAVAGGLLFSALARMAWRASVRQYTSASS